MTNQEIIDRLVIEHRERCAFLTEANKPIEKFKIHRIGKTNEVMLEMWTMYYDP